MDTVLFMFAQYEVKVGPLPHVAATSDKIQTVLTIAFSIVGALSVLMFALGGLRYIASQGDPQQIAKAKNTLIYSVIGTIVSIMAVAIVTFVLGRV